MQFVSAVHNEVFPTLGNDTIAILHLDTKQTVALVKLRVDEMHCTGIFLLEQPGQEQTKVVCRSATLFNQSMSPVSRVLFPIDLQGIERHELPVEILSGDTLTHTLARSIRPLQSSSCDIHTTVCETVSMLLGKLEVPRSVYDRTILALVTEEERYEPFYYGNNGEAMYRCGKILAETSRKSLSSLTLEESELLMCNLHDALTPRTRRCLAKKIIDNNSQSTELLRYSARVLGVAPRGIKKALLAYRRLQDLVPNSIADAKAALSLAHLNHSSDSLFRTLVRSVVLLSASQKGFYCRLGFEVIGDIENLIIKRGSSGAQSLVSALRENAATGAAFERAIYRIGEQLVDYRLAAAATWADAVTTTAPSAVSYALAARIAGLKLYASEYTDYVQRERCERYLNISLGYKKRNLMALAQCASAAQVLGKQKVARDLLASVVLRSGKSSLDSLVLATELCLFGLNDDLLQHACKKLYRLREHTKRFLPALCQRMNDADAWQQKIIAAARKA